MRFCIFMYLEVRGRENTRVLAWENKSTYQVEIYNWLATKPVSPGGSRYWRCTGIIPGGKRLGTGIRPKRHSAGSCLPVLARY